VEGPTDDPEVLALRARQQRNFLTTLLLSQGVPMISHGDELGRSQQGNNNAYCQDSPLTWVDWERADTPLAEFTAAVARLRRQHPTFRRRRFFDGHPVERGAGEPLPDVVMMTPAGEEMRGQDWDSGFGRSIAVYLNGHGIRGTDDRGQPIVDDSFLLLFNAHDGDLAFTLPPEEFGPAWRMVIDTAGIAPGTDEFAAGTVVTVAAKGTVVLMGVSGAATEEPDVLPAAAVPVDAPPVAPG
jgi:glycogen operon protein